MIYETIKNFLPEDKFKRIQKIITSDYFPWYQKNGDEYSKSEIEEGFLSHSFFSFNKVDSVYSDQFMGDIYQILKPKALIQVRANLFFSSFFNNKKAKWHMDYKYNNYTAIFYINTTEGGTEFKINNKIKFIKAEENKIVIFNSNTLHRPFLSPTREKRYIININYFWKNFTIN